MSFRIGIDVGGTHTDAVILDDRDKLVWAEKVDTTENVSTGINQALEKVLQNSSVDRTKIIAVMFGTTHCTNAYRRAKKPDTCRSFADRETRDSRDIAALFLAQGSARRHRGYLVYSFRGP